MSEESTQEQDGKRSFEERVLSMLTEMRSDFNARLERLEAKQCDTKPIWQQALAEIVELRQEMRERFDTVDRKFDLLIKDVFQLRTEQSRADTRLEKLESRR